MKSLTVALFSQYNYFHPCKSFQTETQKEGLLQKTIAAPLTAGVQAGGWLLESRIHTAEPICVENKTLTALKA